MAKHKKRQRNVMREIRHEHRDPFRVRLKPTARFSRDPNQLLLPGTPPPLPYYATLLKRGS
jgi:hypothetical protein